MTTIEHARDEALLDWARSGAPDLNLDDVGVLGFGHSGRRRPARRQARRVALGGAEAC